MSRVRPRLRLKVVVPAAAFAIVVLATAIPLALAGSPAFFARYAELERSYESLQASAHADIACDACHAGSRIAFRASSAAEFYVDLVKRADSPAWLRMSKPTRAACIACHAEEWSDDAERTKRIPHPAHLRVATEKRDCVSCHKWVAHEEEYMERHKTMPFSGVCTSFGCHVGTKTAEECRDCHHALAQDQAAWIAGHRDVVARRGPSTCLEVCHEVGQCRSCHTTGRKPDVKGPKRETGFQALQDAHAKPDWLALHGGEALKNQSRCTFCHVSDGECRACHARRPAFHGPRETWLVEHKKLAEDERRCLTCHKKPWCEQCHAQFKETW